jgi:dihydrofolate reductase
MARLIYAMNTSLDGYISDRDGKFEWGAPTPELFAAINEFQRPIGTYLYGRHLYETMAVWETAHLEGGDDSRQSPRPGAWVSRCDGTCIV